MLADTRTTLLVAFQYLPLILICFVGFLAMGLGNIGLFVLFLGHTTLVPLVTELIRLVTKGYPSSIVMNDAGSFIPNHDATSNIMPSYWMANISFFMAYLLTNAVSVYMLKPVATLQQWRIDSRKSRAATIIVTTLSIWAMLIGLRWYAVKAEAATGVALATIVFGLLGLGWYQVAGACGAVATDVFGIVTQMVADPAALKPTATNPITCVYNPTPSQTQ